MDCQWIKKSQSLDKGLSIINHLEEGKFEQLLRRIISKLKLQDTEIFTVDERSKLENIFKIDKERMLLAIKTVLYLIKRMLKYIFMPANLKGDLQNIGINNEKAEVFVKVWSTETHTTLYELGAEIISDPSDTLNFPWKLNAELSSDYHKKCKLSKAYLTFAAGKGELELELTHPEVYSMFLQFESVQNELDNLM